MSEQAKRDIGLFECFDCGWIGNCPDVEEDHQEGWEEPWTWYGCPECGEAVAAFELRGFEND